MFMTRDRVNVLEAVEVTRVYSIGDRRIPVVDRV